ncbi:unnamed protein product [Brachionus calyciflorus]|uniref:Uncharacterized protein n=1 Tax=Brachionus calyciflorus TaxID=104777 RepID=A0A814E144_9BILA|nr:unnamed protein product [Brachionus calyciflorus]
MSLDITVETLDETRYFQSEFENLADITIEIEQNMSLLDSNIESSNSNMEPANIRQANEITKSVNGAIASVFRDFDGLPPEGTILNAQKPQLRPIGLSNNPCNDVQVNRDVDPVFRNAPQEDQEAGDVQVDPVLPVVQEERYDEFRACEGS